MKARIIVLVTILIAWAPNLFMRAQVTPDTPQDKAEMVFLLLPATGGFYPLSGNSGDPTYHPILMRVWIMGELLVFGALAVVAFIKRSIRLAIICSLLWLGSVTLFITRLFLSISSFDWSRA